jgi:hypothetical protein
MEPPEAFRRITRAHLLASCDNFTPRDSFDQCPLTSLPNGVNYGAVGHCCFMYLSSRNLDGRRVTMATNGEWKVLVDIL